MTFCVKITPDERTPKVWKDAIPLVCRLVLLDKHF